MAIALCEEMNLERLRKSISASDVNSLSVFFTVKTHKESAPFRAIVTEKGSWQGSLSRFLQKHLSAISLDDPFLVKNSNQVIAYFSGVEASCPKRFAFSIDVEDLFYSIPHPELFCAVRTFIEDAGPVAFQNMTGLSTDNFLELLRFYLSSTIVTFNDRCLIQKEGVCIGSCLAPLLSDIFLSTLDKRIQASLYNASVLKVFRYVDDYLVVMNATEARDRGIVVDDIIDIFVCNAFGMKFTHELPQEGHIQYLDVCFIFEETRVCWQYKPRSRKQIINYKSAHSKLVKRAIAKNCIRSALAKSCEHRVRESVHAQLRRLEKAGFQREIVASVVESQISEVKSGGRHRQVDNTRPQQRPVVVPYWHKVSHRLKKVGDKCGVRVVFSAPEKLGRLCRLVNEPKKRSACKIRHTKALVDCKVGVVYNIPLACGKRYIGQTGRCINERLLEHRRTVTSISGGGHLADHIRRCSYKPACKAFLEETSVLRKFRTQKSREIFEALCIANDKDHCVSTPSIVLRRKELDYLKANGVDRVS